MRGLRTNECPESRSRKALETQYLFRGLIFHLEQETLRHSLRLTLFDRFLSRKGDSTALQMIIRVFIAAGQIQN